MATESRREAHIRILEGGFNPPGDVPIGLELIAKKYATGKPHAIGTSSQLGALDTIIPFACTEKGRRHVVWLRRPAIIRALPWLLVVVAPILAAVVGFLADLKTLAN